jgi:hypothetical protein
MAKQSGMGWTAFSVDDALGAVKTIVNDITSAQISTPRGVQDVTGIDKSAIERLLLLADCSLTVNGVFNITDDMSHEVFSTVSSTDVARTTTMTISGKTLAPEIKYSDYSLNRAQDGSLTFTAPGANASGGVPTWA